MRQLSLLDEVKKAYQEHRSAFIPGATMQAILLALGARLEDFAKLQQVSGNLADDPTLPSASPETAASVSTSIAPRLSGWSSSLRALGRGRLHPLRFGKAPFPRHQRRPAVEYGIPALMKFKAYVIDGVSVTPRARLNQRSTSSSARCSTCAPSPRRRCWANRRWKACTATASTTP